MANIVSQHFRGLFNRLMPFLKFPLKRASMTRSTLPDGGDPGYWGIGFMVMNVVKIPGMSARGKG